MRRPLLSVSPSLKLLVCLKALLSLCRPDARLQSHTTSPPSLFPDINLASLKAPAGKHVTHRKTWLDPVSGGLRQGWEHAFGRWKPACQPAHWWFKVYGGWPGVDVGEVSGEHEAVMGENGLHNLLGIAHTREGRDRTASGWQARKRCLPQNIVHEIQKWFVLYTDTLGRHSQSQSCSLCVTWQMLRCVVLCWLSLQRQRERERQTEWRKDRVEVGGGCSESHCTY